MIRKTSNQSLWTAAAAIAALFTMQAAVAGINDDPPSLVVKYDDLNLASAAGAKTLYRRIELAADRVCNVADSRELSMQSLQAACFKDAVASAVMRVNVPAVTALHDSRSFAAGRSS